MQNNGFENPPRLQLEWLLSGKQTMTKAGMDVGEEELIHCWQGYEFVQPL